MVHLMLKELLLGHKVPGLIEHFADLRQLQTTFSTKEELLITFPHHCMPDSHSSVR